VKAMTSIWSKKTFLRRRFIIRKSPRNGDFRPVLGLKITKTICDVNREQNLSFFIQVIDTEENIHI